jgi:DNA-binding beta-propeller fold protein YncE
MLEALRRGSIVLLSAGLALALSCAPGGRGDGGDGGEGEGGEGEGEEGEGEEGEGEGGEGEGEPATEIGVGGDQPFDEEAGDGVIVRDDGALTIGGSGVAITHTLIWIANSTQGTVSKIDTRTHEELGRYRTGGDYMDPSRTAVNRDGHVVVANRGYSSATRILASDCPDTNGDGTVRTSTGGDDILAWGEDECVTWNTPVGNSDAGARGTVVEERFGLDGAVEEYAWVGAYNEMTMWEIRTATGEHTGRIVNIAPCLPYGAALGPGGKLWATGGSDLVEIDTTTGDVTQHPIPEARGSYGITVDGNGDVWTGVSIQRYRNKTSERS